MRATIIGVGSYAPANRVHNDQLAESMETSDEWIYSRTGIHYRHIAAENEAASDLAAAAGERALTQAHVSPDELDLILVATSTPDYLGLPSTAAVVQHRLGAVNAGAMDVVAACTGFVYALETARVYVSAGAARKVLVIGSEVYSKIVDWEDRGTSVLFGDGAGAAVVVPTPDDSTSHIEPAFLAGDGSGAEVLGRLAGGTRKPIAPEAPVEEQRQSLLYMDGRRVYNFAVRAVPSVIETLMKRHDLSVDEIDWVVPHQANVRIIREAAKRSGIPFERFYTNMDEYANTSAASIPIALDEMVAKGALERGMKIITVGFGAGLTYGGAYIVW